MTIKKEINKLLIKQIGGYIDSQYPNKSIQRRTLEDKIGNFYIFEFENMIIVYKNPNAFTEDEDSVYIKSKSSNGSYLLKDVDFDEYCVSLDDDSQRFLKSKILPIILKDIFKLFKKDTFEYTAKLIKSLDNSLDEESPEIKAQDFVDKYLDFTKIYDIKKVVMRYINKN